VTTVLPPQPLGTLAAKVVRTKTLQIRQENACNHRPQQEACFGRERSLEKELPHTAINQYFTIGFYLYINHARLALPCIYTVSG